MAADSSVWGPNDEDRQQHFADCAYVETPNGWRCEELAGAISKEDWEAWWQFATKMYIHSGSIHPGVCRKYAKRFLALIGNFPQCCWWLGMIAETKYRCKRAPMVLRRLVKFHKSHPAVSGFDEEKPWNSVLLEAIDGPEAVAYWKTELEDPCNRWLRNISGRQCQSDWLARQYALGAPKASKRPAATHTDSDKEEEQQPKKKKAKRGVKAQASAAPSGRNDRARKDGRLRTCYGTPFCFPWARAGGCVEGLVCPMHHAHACEFCRGPHRNSECEQRPGGQPSASKGAGKNVGQNTAHAAGKGGRGGQNRGKGGGNQRRVLPRPSPQFGV